MSGWYERGAGFHRENRGGSCRGFPGPGFRGGRLPDMKPLSGSTLYASHEARSVADRASTQDPNNQLQELLVLYDRMGDSDFDGSGSGSRDFSAARPSPGSRGGGSNPTNRCPPSVSPRVGSVVEESENDDFNTTGGSREGRPILGLRGGGSGPGSRRSSPAASTFDETEDGDDERFAEEGNFDGASAFGGAESRSDGTHGSGRPRNGGYASSYADSPFGSGPFASGTSPVPHLPAGPRPYPRHVAPFPNALAGGEASGHGGSPFTGDGPFYGNFGPGRRMPHHPYLEYAALGGYHYNGDAILVPRSPGHGLVFDPEYLHGAVGNEEDMDNLVSRLMAAGPGAEEGPPPASQSDIAKLKKKKVDRSMLAADGKADCSVCMEDVRIGEDVTELPCRHWFHGHCITAWLSSHGTCPHCRRNITSNEGPSRRTRPVPSDSAWPDPEGEFDRPMTQYDEVVARRIQRRLRPTAQEDEAYARRLQDDLRASVHDDEAMARRLQEESDFTTRDDEALARRLQEESRLLTHDDEALARRLQEESRPLIHDDGALARRLYEETLRSMEDDAELARQLQEEEEREFGGY